jgi:transcriptional regulator with XRE-family HTH domain
MQPSISPGSSASILEAISSFQSILPIGFIIRRIREFDGLTQGELALMSEANLSYISTIESGVNNISIKKLLLICNALHLSPVLLMGIWQNIMAVMPSASTAAVSAP